MKTNRLRSRAVFVIAIAFFLISCPTEAYKWKVVHDFPDFGIKKVCAGEDEEALVVGTRGSIVSIIRVTNELEIIDEIVIDTLKPETPLICRCLGKDTVLVVNAKHGLPYKSFWLHKYRESSVDHYELDQEINNQNFNFNARFTDEIYFWYLEGPEMKMKKSYDFGRSAEIVDLGDDFSEYFGIFKLQIAKDNSVFFLSRNSDNGYVFFKSSGGGKSWTHSNYEFSNYNFGYYFFDYKRGFYLDRGRPKIYETTDSGENWISIYDTSSSSGEGLYFFDFYDEKHGIAYSPMQGFYTSDSGGNWNVIIDYEDPFFPIDFSSIVLLSPDKFAAIDKDKHSLWYYDIGAVGVEDKADSRPLLSPNPASPGETITVSVPESAGVCRVRLLDGFGRTISEIEEPATNSKLEFRLPEGLASGIYWLRIECGGEIFVEKFVVLE